MSESGDNDQRGGLATLAFVGAGACLLIVLLSLANLVTFGSLFWAGVLVVLLLGGSAAYFLHRIKPGELTPLAAEGAGSMLHDTGLASAGVDVDDDSDPLDEDEDEDADADEGTAKEERSRAKAGSAPGAPRDDFERLMSKRDNDLEILLADAKSEPVTQQGDTAVKLRDRANRLRDELGRHNRQQEPMVWAAFMHALGEAKFDQGNFLCSTGQFADAVRGVACFKEAVQSYRRSLKERTRITAPQDYAVTQARLGEALLAMARREPVPQYLDDSLASLREAASLLLPGSKDAAHTQSLLKIAEDLAEVRKTEQPSEPWTDL